MHTANLKANQATPIGKRTVGQKKGTSDEKRKKEANKYHGMVDENQEGRGGATGMASLHLLLLMTL